MLIEISERDLVHILAGLLWIVPSEAGAPTCVPNALGESHGDTIEAYTEVELKNLHESLQQPGEILWCAYDGDEIIGSARDRPVVESAFGDLDDVTIRPFLTGR